MPLDVAGISYFSVSELLEDLDISRQTLWRWRKEGRIPVGRRYRDGKVIFTREEAEEIKQFANRIEPISEVEKDQLALF